MFSLITQVVVIFHFALTGAAVISFSAFLSMNRWKKSEIYSLANCVPSQASFLVSEIISTLHLFTFRAFEVFLYSLPALFPSFGGSAVLSILDSLCLSPLWSVLRILSTLFALAAVSIRGSLVLIEVIGCFENFAFGALLGPVILGFHFRFLVNKTPLAVSYPFVVTHTDNRAGVRSNNTIAARIRQLFCMCDKDILAQKFVFIKWRGILCSKA